MPLRSPPTSRRGPAPSSGPLRPSPHGGEKLEHWSGRTGFVLATIGSAIGLGSIWKFPYEVGANGGGAFVVFYLIGLVLIVLPLMLVEFAIGRRGKSDASRSVAVVAEMAGASSRWSAIGVLGVITSFLILSFYSVIGGWAVAYAVETVRTGLPGTDASAVQMRFDALLASPVRMAGYHAAFMTFTAWVVGRGIVNGIEIASRILMPVLMALITLLALYSMVAGDLGKSLRFLFALDISHMTPKVALEALGLGFFSIGVGLAVMITYAAHAQRDIDLREVAIVTIVGDTAISFAAGLAVFPIVFANDLDPSSGPGLVFVTLPLAFSHMPLGLLAAVTFFVLLVVAALASAMAFLEMPVAFLTRRLSWRRPIAAAACGFSCWLIGIATVLSFNLWAGWFPLAMLPGLGAATIFEVLDHLTSNILLPIAGLGLAIFGGWIIADEFLASELELGSRAVKLLRVVLRYVATPAILAAGLAPLFLRA
jgi:neurotransmitter:Na+ symporter, NSS family